MKAFCFKFRHLPKVFFSVWGEGERFIFSRVGLNSYDKNSYSIQELSLQKLKSLFYDRYLSPLMPNITGPLSNSFFYEFSLPFDNSKNALEAWKEYLPAHLQPRRDFMLACCVKRGDKNSLIQVFGISNKEVDIQGKLYPSPIALASLSIYFKEKNLLFLSEDSSAINVTLVSKGIVLDFLAAPHITSKDKQLIALIKSLSLPKDTFYVALLKNQEGLASLIKLPEASFSKKPIKNITSEKLFSLGLALASTHPIYNQCYKPIIPQKYSTLISLNKKVFSLLWGSSFLAMALLTSLGVIQHKKNQEDALGLLKEMKRSLSLPLDQNKNTYTKAEYLNQIDQLSKLSKGAKPPFHLFPNFPALTKVFMLLYNYPTTELKLLDFSYQLIERPTQRSPQHPYRAKVRLELSCLSENAAQKFHDDITQNSWLIDSKKPVSWKSSQNHYTLSFYLKEGGNLEN